ncbi:MAG: methionyl-tRNA formyltransferase [Firmicutes bacterium]|nr:methionyl-tRNA formyltransferase [Bacillota bacterium]
MNIVYLGTPQFAVLPLQAVLNSTHSVAAVISQPNRETDKKGRVMPTPVAEFAQQNGLRVLQYPNVCTREAIAAVAALKPDVMVTAAFGQLLSAEFLSIAPVYNIHASLLPAYRGSAPIQAAILNGESQTGITVMKTVLAMDAGDILLSQKIAIEADEPFYSLHDRLSALGAVLLVKALDLLQSGSFTLTPQNPRLATYTKKITKADGLLDFSLSAEILARRVRAYNPWPAAFTFYKGQYIKIYAAKSIKTEPMRNIPCGTVIKSCQKEGIWVQCGQDALNITSLQISGKRVLSAAEFLRGFPLAEGARLGQEGLA